MRDQIARLAEASRPFCVPNGTSADEDGDTYCRHCGVGMNVEAVRHCGSQPDVGAALLAEFDRLSKIEAAARDFMDIDCEPPKGVGGEMSYNRPCCIPQAEQEKAHEEWCRRYDALAAALAPSTGKSEKP